MGIKTILKPKKSPEQLLKHWQRRLQYENQKIERHIQDAEKQEVKAQKSFRDASKRNDMVSAKELAGEIVRLRKTVQHLHTNKAHLNSITMHLGECIAIVHTVGYLSKSDEMTKLVHDLMKGPEVSSALKEFRKEMTKAGVIDEIAYDPIHKTFKESEEEVNEVLTQMGIADAA